MKTDSQMDQILNKAFKNPAYLKDILPIFQSFATYGNIKPYLHYRLSINEVCKKWIESHEMATIVINLAEAYVEFCLGKYAQTKQSILKISSKLDLNRSPYHFAFAETLLGVCKRDIGEIDAALVHFLNVVRSPKKLKSVASLRCYAYYFIAEIHMQINDIKTAGKNYKKALSIAKRWNHDIALFRSLIGLGAWYQVRNKHKKSIRFFKRALKIDTISETARAKVLGDLGRHHLSLNQYKKAISYLEQSYQLAMSHEYSNPASTSLIYLGKTYLALNKPKAALPKLNEALEISQLHNTRAKQMEIEALLATTHEMLANFEKAYQHLKTAQQLSDEITTEKQKEIFKIKNRLIEEQKEVIKKERDKSNKLLLNILPPSIASELKENQFVEPKRYEQVSVLFADFVGFTSISEALSSEELVKTLDIYFRAFDEIITKYRLEKIKTIGDAYMCAGGLPINKPTHAYDALRAGLEMQSFVHQRLKDPKVDNSTKWHLRVGIHSGPIIAGVVGDIKFAYDIWGDTVNTAARIESNGQQGKVNVSESTFECLTVYPEFTFTARGKINVKGKGALEMYFAEFRSIQ